MRAHRLLLVVLGFALLSLRLSGATPTHAQPAPQEAPVEHGVYLLDLASGQTLRLGGPFARAAWSPDGTSIAVVDAGLRLVRPASGDETVVVPPELGLVEAMQWSPDSTRLAFNLFPPGYAEGPRRGLYVVHADGTRMTRLSADTASDLAWTPDGQGLTVVQLAPDAGPAGQGAAPRPVWLWRVVVLDPESGATRAVIMPERRGMCPNALSWSPDGAYLAFAVGGVQNDPCFYPTPDTSPRGLWVWEAATGMLRWLGGRVWGRPLWLPDGSILAQTVGTPDGPNPLINVRADGGEVRSFARPGPVGSFIVSNFPETAAGVVLYVPYHCNTGGVYIIDPGSSEPRRLTDPSTTVISASLAPNGSHAAWATFAPQASSLVVGAVDGGESRTVLHGASAMLLLGWDPWSALTSAWSPDGRALLFAVTDDPSTAACG